jgi:HlyD family type I secretion membrane fusion protein
MLKPWARSSIWRVVSAAMGSTAVSRVFAARSQDAARQPTVPALLEFESPTGALIEAPVKPAARSVLWTVVSAVIVSMIVAGLFPIDMVVTGAGRVVSLRATNVMQPLETSIVRAINVREGQTVRAGELLARLDPTFSGADESALQAQVKSFQAEVDRLSAEASSTPYQPTTTDAATALQVAIYGQRQAQYGYQIEGYNQKISGLQAQLTRAEHDVKAFSERAQIASVIESKRRELERLQVGSLMNRLVAEDQRIEMQRNLTDATGAAERARRELQQITAERDGFEQQWKAKIGEELTLRRRSLSDATENLRKATLRRELVDLRADQDAVVLSVAKVSVGSVMQSGEQLMTLVPTDAPLEVEMRIAASDAGYVHPGQKVAIKFDTFPFVQYGMAEGTVRFISPDSFTGAQETQRGTVVSQGDHAVFYKARVVIDELKMHGVPGGFQLKPGMTVTADIKAGKRTLLTYLFARILPIGLEGMREP